MAIRISLILGLLAVSFAFADSWLPAEPIVVSSADTEIVVRIEPSEATFDSARATYFRRQDSPEQYVVYQRVFLTNPVRPMEAYVSNEGVLVTVENYGSPGFNDVVTIYDIDGQELRTYDIQNMYTEAAITEMSRTVTIREWRNPDNPPWFENDALWITDIFGNILKFSTDDGSISIIGPHTERFQAGLQNFVDNY